MGRPLHSTALLLATILVLVGFLVPISNAQSDGPVPTEVALGTQLARCDYTILLASKCVASAAIGTTAEASGTAQVWGRDSVDVEVTAAGYGAASTNLAIAIPTSERAAQASAEGARNEQDSITCVEFSLLQTVSCGASVGGAIDSGCVELSTVAQASNIVPEMTIESAATGAACVSDGQVNEIVDRTLSCGTDLLTLEMGGESKIDQVVQDGMDFLGCMTATSLAMEGPSLERSVYLGPDTRGLSHGPNYVSPHSLSLRGDSPSARPWNGEASSPMANFEVSVASLGFQSSEGGLESVEEPAMVMNMDELPPDLRDRLEMKLRENALNQFDNLSEEWSSDEPMAEWLQEQLRKDIKQAFTNMEGTAKVTLVQQGGNG